MPQECPSVVARPADSAHSDVTILSRRAAAALLGAAAGGFGAAAGLLAAPAALARSARNEARPTPVEIEDATLMRAFVKARSALDGRITIGWLDGLTYAFSDGATWPLYRLYAATWQRHEPRPDGSWSATQLEIAFFADVDSGRPLEKLTMPITGKVVDVPKYRAGPSRFVVKLREETRDEFQMARETTQGERFFQTGASERFQQIGHPQRAGDELWFRQDIQTRVLPAGAASPSFFYREWTLNRMRWRDVNDARVVSAESSLAYSAIAAFRPWMQMQGVNGHTLQNGLGGKVQRAEELPAELLRLTRQAHPDLLEAPEKALAHKA